jgi:hypothetical protein
MHDVCDVSQLKKWLRIPEGKMSMGERDLGGDLSYDKRPINILETTERVTQRKVMKMCKVHWIHHMKDKTMWEYEELRTYHPELFFKRFWISRMRFHGVLGGSSWTGTTGVTPLVPL